MQLAGTNVAIFAAVCLLVIAAGDAPTCWRASV